MDLYLKAALAGVFFGVWPLLMNRSGLSGNMSAGVFTGVVLVGLLPFALYSSGGVIPKANWAIVIVAGFFGVLGMLFFNGMLAGATSANVGQLFIFTTVIQVVIPAVYQTVKAGQLEPDKAVGYIAAMVAAYLLLR